MAESGRRRRAAGLLACLAGAGLQGWGGWQAWAHGGAAADLAAVGAGAILFGVGLRWLEDRRLRLLGWLYLGLAAFVPPYGSFGALFLFVFRRRTRGTGLARDYAEYIDGQTAKEHSGAQSLAGDSVDQMVRHELNVQSYMDIMRGPDRLLKKALIGRILSTWTPNAVPLLRVALRDIDYEIRSYASTALTDIESRMSENLVTRRQAVAAGGSALDSMRLAEAYLDYVASGLLDAATAAHYVELARTTLDNAPLTPDDDGGFDWLLLRAQAARAAADDDTERRLCEGILAVRPEHAETLRQLCELDFRQGRAADLRRHAQLLLARTGDDHPAAAAARLWVAAGEGVT